MTTPAGLNYLPEVDGLALKLFQGDETPCDLHGHWTEYPDLHLRVSGQVGDDGRLYSLLIPDASRHVPPAVLRRGSEQVLRLVEASDEPGTWLLPLFPQAGAVGRTRLALDLRDGQKPVHVLLAKSHRVVGFLVPNGAERLPVGVVGDYR